jgi:hypothetical protein
VRDLSARQPVCEALTAFLREHPQDTTVVLARRQCEALITPAVEVSALQALVKKWRDPAWFSTHGWDEYAYDVAALCDAAEGKK